MKLSILIIVTLILCGCGNPYPDEKKELYEGQKIAMPEYYRHITGYDSIQVVYYKPGSMLGNGWEGHFCYPNEWQFEKFKKIKVDSIVFHYDSILVLHYNQSEVK